MPFNGPKSPSPSGKVLILLYCGTSVGTAKDFNYLGATPKILSNCLATGTMGLYGHKSSLCMNGIRRSAVRFLWTLLISSFSVRPERARFSVTTRAGAGTPSAAAVKADRRDAFAPSSPASRSRLDGGEHGVRLAAVGTCCGYPQRLMGQAIQRRVTVQVFMQP
jgi:hypothetical protein